MRVEHYHRRRQELGGWPAGVVSYKLGDRYVCEVDNVNPGTRIARAEATTRDDAEREALQTAEARLAQTRVVAVDGAGRDRLQSVSADPQNIAGGAP